jgi:hypothetical protein
VCEHDAPEEPLSAEMSGQQPATSEGADPGVPSEQAYIGPQTNIPPAQTARHELTFSTSVRLQAEPSDAVRSQIAKLLQRRADSLSAKIHEVEQDERVPGAEEPEVTASTVIKAEAKLNERLTNTKKSKWDVALRLSAPISSGAAGILGSYLNSTFQSALFGFVAAFAVFTTALMVMRGRGA